MAMRRTTTERIRCPWARGDQYVEYHDAEWGCAGSRRPVALRVSDPRRGTGGPELGHDPQEAGELSGSVRPLRPGCYCQLQQGETGEPDVECGDRPQRLKIESAIDNAKAFRVVQHEFGSFEEFIWGFVEGQTRQHAWRSMADVPAPTLESDAMSKELKRRGFRFVGSTICYAFMQAVGMVNDHLVECFRHAELVPRLLAPGVPEWFVYILRCADDTLYTGITKRAPPSGAAQRGYGITLHSQPPSGEIGLQGIASHPKSGTETRAGDQGPVSPAKGVADSSGGTDHDASPTTMIVRLSQKLCTKIKTGKLSEMPLDDNPFAGWSAHLFVADRTQYILLSNTKSLYSTVMYGKGITCDGHFIGRALSSIREFMEDDGQKAVYLRFIAPASGTVRFAKALDRSVTGSMNQLVAYAILCLAERDMSPHDVGFELNDFLLSSIARSKADKYGTPKEAFKAMVSGEGA